MEEAMEPRHEQRDESGRQRANARTPPAFFHSLYADTRSAHGSL